MQFSHTVLASTDSNAFASVRERTTTRDERFALGRSLREKVPISALGVWNATQARPDPIALINASHHGRVKELVPIRVGRMVSSPYGFYRGSAVVMAGSRSTWRAIRTDSAAKRTLSCPATSLNALYCSSRANSRSRCGPRFVATAWTFQNLSRP